MKHLSLFNGIGGFQLAAHWAGWENVAHVEIDGWCNDVVNQYFPGSELHTDIHTFDGRKYRGKIDVVTGGFPCQPFSQAGNRKGSDDNRYLWPEMLRVIDEIRPSYVLGENVVGIVSMVQQYEDIEVGYQNSLFEEAQEIVTQEAEFVIETIRNDLERIGYSVQFFIIPAASVGAWHKRDRLWILAHTDSSARTDISGEDKEENGVSEVSRETIRGGKPTGTGDECGTENVPDSDNIGTRSGSGSLPKADGEVSQRHDNAEFGNSGEEHVPHAKDNGRRGRKSEECGGEGREVLPEESERGTMGCETSGCGGERTAYVSYTEHHGSSNRLTSKQRTFRRSPQRRLLQPKRKSSSHSYSQGRRSGRLRNTGKTKRTRHSTKLFGKLGRVFPHTYKERLQRSKRSRTFREEEWPQAYQPTSELFEISEGRYYWAAEPLLDRVAHGIPRRVDRIKGLGNAIVPQVALQFMRAINLTEEYYEGD